MFSNCRALWKGTFLQGKSLWGKCVFLLMWMILGKISNAKCLSRYLFYQQPDSLRSTNLRTDFQMQCGHFVNYHRGFSARELDKQQVFFIFPEIPECTEGLGQTAVHLPSFQRAQNALGL